MNDTQEESDDGYDSDLFENPEKAAEFKCPICTCICKDPIETEPCGHLYCRGCLQSHLNLKSVSDINMNANDTNKEPSYCPSCRAKIQETSRSKFVERQVLKLRVKCANYLEGCPWKGELNYFKKHLQKQCKFVTVTCEFCKNTQYLRGKEEEHLSQCQDVSIQCKLCSLKIKRKSFTIHTEKLCPNLLILCPNKCGDKIKQSLLTNHISNQCEYRRVDCLYNVYGCSIKPKYNDLKLHLSQHQVVHLELKVLYLERLAQSTELLSISNTTGIYPEISGMYQREEKPYFARPVWRNRNNKTYLIRYDHILRGWVLDKKGFDRDIVALRIGKYPTAVAKHQDPKHVLILEQMLINDNNNHNKNDKNIDDKDKDNKDDKAEIIEENKDNQDINDDNNDENKEDEDDEKKIEDDPLRDTVQVNGVQDVPRKRGLFSDGLWHIKGNVENSRIKVQGYTEREFDLEWEFKSLAAQMRRQRSGIQHVTHNKAMNNNNMNNNNNDIQKNGNGVINPEMRLNYVVSCICGKGTMRMNTNPYSINNKELNAICNVCENRILSGIEFYHCPAKRCAKHIEGYDLCLSCGEARQQTQNLTQPTCDCGTKLNAIMSFNAYPNATGVSCNVCKGIIDGAVWHCSKQYSKSHERGFDLCINCGKTYTAKKAGIMSWLTSRQ